MGIVSRQTLILIAVLAAGSACAQDTVIYKTVDKNGAVSYSQDKPAEDAGQTVTTISVPTLPPEQQRAANRALLAMDKREDADYQAHREKQKAADARIDAALKRLQQAEQRLAQGSQVRGGDRVGNVNGYTRLRDSYFNRVSQLEADVARAKQDLDAAYSARDQY
ncbi:MAG: DUF4124 domain-containing protein [Burkholderiaceae bacterium]|nr:DUF4124 domain-containing protein [Burkholderiaceae bacterium]